MAVVSIVATALSLSFVFHFSIKTEETHLRQMVQSQAVLIQTIHLFEAETHGGLYPGGPGKEALRHAVTALDRQHGFGRSGEFVLGREKDGTIEFLVTSRLIHRHPDPLPMTGDLAKPMQRALAGENGLITTLDYRGVKVLAAHQFIPELGVGLVSKIDTEELHEPFINSVLLALAIAIFTIGLGTLLVWQMESSALGKNYGLDHIAQHQAISWVERTFYLVLIMAVVTLAVTTAAHIILYQASYNQTKSFLSEMVNNQKNLIELIGHREGEKGLSTTWRTNQGNTLARFVDAYAEKNGFGQSGEFVLGQLNGKYIQFLLRSTITGQDVPKIPITSNIAQPMRLALAGQQGVVAEKDYRAVDVLAAYASLEILQSGLVAKIDMSEIRQPFFSAGIQTFIVSVVLIIFGAIVISKRMAASETDSLNHVERVITPLHPGDQPALTLPLVVLTLWMGIAILALDIAMPLGVAGGVPYVAFVMLGRWYPKRSQILGLAMIASLLTLAGYLLSTSDGILWMVLTNRLYALFAIWTVALILSLVRASEIKIFRQTTELRKLSSALEQGPSAVMITDPDGRIEFVNTQFTRMTGYQLQEVVGENPRLLKSPDQDPQAYESLWKRIIAKEMWQGELLNMKKSGEPYWSSLSISPLCDAAGEVCNFVGVQYDITQRKQTEKRLAQVNRDLQTRYRFSEILASATGEITTLHQLCQVMVDEAGYRLAWVGFIDQGASKRVVPVAQHGFEMGFPEQLESSWDEDSPSGQGPAGHAVRSGMFQISQDVQHDLNYKPWREEALKRGIASSIALPLEENGTLFGILNLYSSLRNTFDETEVQLLTGLTQHMSEGIRRLREMEKRRKAERDLAQSEQRFRALFNAMNSGVAVFRIGDDGKDFMLRDINQAGVKINHLDGLEQVFGKSIGIIFDNAHESGLFAVCQEVFNTGLAKQHSATLFQGKPHQIWLENYIFQLESKEIVVIFDDVTDKKRAETQFQLAQVSLENTNDMVFWVHPDGRFLRFNQAVINRLGYTRETLLTMRASDLNPKHPQNVWPDHWRELKRKGLLTFEADLVRKNARALPVEICANYMKFNDQEYNLAVVRDITERRELETNLRLSEEKAQQANTAKGQFLAKMSHEIRTPMNSIIGMCYLARQTPIFLEKERYLTRINTAANALLHIINDILDFSKIDAGKLELEQNPFNLIEALEQVVDGLSIKMQNKKNVEMLISLPVDIPVNLVGDALRLGQVLTNLGDNALKFTDKGEVLIAVQSHFDDDDGVQLEFLVQDTGIGIPADHIGKLFQSFQQSDNSITRKYGGSGLGLVICQNLVEMMGGTISLESEPDRGTSVTLRVRFDRDREKNDPPLVLPEIIHGKRVLVLNTHVTSGRLLQELLGSLRLECRVIHSESEELATFKQTDLNEKPWDIVLLDWRTPDGTGMEILQRIRRDNRLVDALIIVMVSEFDQHAMDAQTRALGVGGFLSKPIMPGKLVTLLLWLYQIPDPNFVVSDSAQSVEDFSGIRVLLVDDLPDNQDLIREVLRHRGADVIVAENGRQAVEKVGLAGTPFDVVLMDIQMPVMDGLEATQRIREMGRFDHLPIIALTASAMAQEVEQCLAAGMNDHLGKPIEIEQLFAKLHQWIRGGGGVPPILPAVFQRNQISSHLEDYPGLDKVASLNRCNGDRILHAQLMAHFIESHGVSGDTITSLLRAHDFNGAFREVHILKNNAGNISAMEVLSIANALEKAIKQQDLPLAQSQLNRLTMAMDTTKASCQKILRELEFGEDAYVPMDRDELFQSLKELGRLLVLKDLGADELLEKIRKQLFFQLTKKTSLMNLDACMKRMDTISAMKALAEIMNHLV